MSDAGESAMDKFDPHGIGPYVSPAGVVSAVLTFFGWIPVILGTLVTAAALAYYLVSLWEMSTIQNYIKNAAARKLAREVSSLEYQQSQIVGRLKQLGVLTHAATDVKQGDMRKTTTTVETSTQPVQQASRDD